MASQSDLCFRNISLVADGEEQSGNRALWPSTSSHSAYQVPHSPYSTPSPGLEESETGGRNQGERLWQWSRAEPKQSQ